MELMRIDHVELGRKTALATGLISSYLVRQTEHRDWLRDIPIRVAHIIGSVCKGGVENVVFNYYRAIDKTTVQFDFIIDEDSPDEIPADVVDMGCRVYKIPSYKHLTDYVKALVKIFNDGNYKIVHSHMNTLSVFSMFAAKYAKIPVRIAHGHSTAGKREFARNVMKYSFRPFSKLFPTHLFACSEYAGRWLFGNSTFDKGEVTVVHNAIDTAKFEFNPSVRERVRSELGLNGKLVLGHIGRFMPQKNHSYLIDIFSEVHKREPNSVLLLIGDGELKARAEEKVRRLGLSERVMFLGARNDVCEFYQALDVFLLPSLYEGMGMVRVEAASAGLPCLVSAGLPRLASAGQTTEIKMINERFIELTDDSLPLWRDAILECKKHRRKSGVGLLKKLGFDIYDEAGKLETLYLSISGEVTYVAYNEAQSL